MSHDDARFDGLLAVAEGVTLRLGLRDILDHVSLSVRPREIVTIVGPNGGGKTMLVRTLLGLQEPTSGAIWRRADLRVGYVPQRLPLDPILPLSARRFIMLGGASRAMAESVAVEIGVGDLLDTPVYGLSGGELQRVLLSRAVVREPQLLVLDEPAQGVDVIGQADFYRLISRIRDRYGCGVLMVSHDIHLVMAATDEVVCLNRHVCCTGHPEAVSRHPAYLELFGREALRGVAVYVHEHDHVHDPSGNVVEEAGADHGKRADHG